MGHPASCPFEIAHPAESSEQVLPSTPRLGKGLNPVQPPFYPGKIAERTRDPAAQQPRSHGGDRQVQQAEKGTLDGSVQQVPGQLEVSLGGWIQCHEVCRRIGLEPVQQSQGRALSVAQVLHQRPARSNGLGERVTSESLQGRY